MSRPMVGCSLDLMTTGQTVNLTRKDCGMTMLMNMMSLPIPIGQAIRKIHLHGESD